MTKAELENNASQVVTNAENTNDQREQFCIVWSGTVKPMLDLIKAFTGPKVDEQIDKLIYAADKVCDGTNPDVSNYCQVWNSFHIKSLLKFVQTFTGPKVDKAIHKFVEISDNFCPH
jgi:hypothetical protein